MRLPPSESYLSCVNAILRAHNPLIFVAAVLLSGCGPNDLQNANGNSGLSPDFQIKKLILQDMFDEQAQNSTVETTAFSEYIINDPLAAELVPAFKGHVPKVTTGIKIGHDDDGHAIDQATGKPVKLFSIRIRQLKSDYAYCGAGWTVETLDGEWFAYDLDRVNGKWVITKRTVAGVS